MIPGSNPNPFDRVCPDCGNDSDDCTCPDPRDKNGARATMPTSSEIDNVQILAERFGSFDSEDLRLMRDAMRGIGWHMLRIRQLITALNRALEIAEWKEAR